MTAVHVTEHAIDRYCERVENAPRDVVRARILAASRGITCAVAFGASVVILGCGARLVIEGASVVTVLGPAQKRSRSRWLGDAEIAGE